ncbi:ATP-binding protein [Lacrimispora sphenoides]|nr:ATP-binding protein [Lacrimispora sphenoides]
MEGQVATILENIKVNFSEFTDHGVQHSLRIIEYVYKILSEEIKAEFSDIEIFCFVMSAFFHDMGMTLADVDNKEEQRNNHHLYAREPVEQYCDIYLNSIQEYRRIRECVSFVCEAHGRDIIELYSDDRFRKVDLIQGQTLRYGLLAILLRIGDLMDIEEGRTNEFNMHLNSSYFRNPVSSQHHKRSLEINTYNYNASNIIIIIKTENRERYKIWDEWLKYLDNEIMYANTHYFSGNNKQMGHYKFPEVIKNIEPAPGADFLVEEIRFQVDEKGALWDILTNSIYTHEFDYIRELIQNAIDATLLKYYTDTNFNIESISPKAWKISDKVYIIYAQSTSTLIVIDHGIGMNEGEIRSYLFKAADSGYKYKKKREEFEFPSIAKFGIGFVACLTKALKIEIITQAHNSAQIKAEIEEKSTVAFIEKAKECETIGTIIKLNIKNKFSFEELKKYVLETFVYPSVNLELIDFDNFNIINEKTKFGERTRFNLDLYEGICNIIDNVKNLNDIRMLYISDYVQDNLLLAKISSILDNNINDLKPLLSGITYKSIVKEKIENIINEKDFGRQKVHDTILMSRKEIEEYLHEYPIFNFEILNSLIDNITNYDFLNIEIDNSFGVSNISRIYKKIKTNSRGILYIRTKIFDSNLGIEWQTISSFIYNKGRIEKNLLRLSGDYENIEDEAIISLNELGDADYEIGMLYEEENDEYYYERVNIMQSENYDDYDTLNNYDVIFINNNEYLIAYNVDSKKIEDLNSTNNVYNAYKLFENTVMPVDNEGIGFQIENSKLYQDGIFMEFNPQIIVPLGVGWSICNLTAGSRFELNASRHELNMSRNIIDVWIGTYGEIIQKSIAEHCVRTFKELGLEYSVEKLLAANQDDTYISKKSYDSMKKILDNIICRDDIRI